ncbi:helix-turn-helix transcriptional regulator [Cellulomonas sp. ICMP 17802]|uniref:helix-turn-helix transcriptional regulator n=1 Tax=Cellulomonas sp. ICMP 17802 TaxID=3239199 RepID=UPI00351B2673
MAELSAVAVLVLALLHEQPMHPYQLHQTLVERGDTRIVRVNAGAVYHGVERLERDGLVEVVGTDRAGRRPERTTYRITDAGRAAFAARLTSLLGDEHPAYPLFTVGLAEANELPADVVVEQLTRRRDREAEHLERLGVSYGAVRERGLPRRFLLDVEHDLAMLRAEVAWLDRTLDELRGDALDWAEPIPMSYLDATMALRPPDTSAKDLS